MRYLLFLLPLSLLACAPSYTPAEREQALRQIHTATAKRTPLPTTAVEINLADIEVWKLCASDWSNEPTMQTQLATVNLIDTDTLTRDRDFSVRVVEIVRRLIEAWPNVKPTEIEELRQTCVSWMKADWEGAFGKGKSDE